MPARPQPSGAPREAPDPLAPMLATLARRVPPRGAWVCEPKWDGLRALVYVDEGVQVRSRTGRDISPQWPELGGLAEALGRTAVLDGELVVLDPEGRPSFERLQQRMNLQHPARVARARQRLPGAYLVFDLLWLDGTPLWPRPWRERRAALEALPLAGPHWRLSPVSLDPPAMVEAAQALGLEGVVLKRPDAPYQPGRRSPAWVKVKFVHRQELVIGGWVPGEGGRAGRLGALVVGYHEGEALRLAGKVGTGFSEATLAELADRLAPLAQAESPFADPVPWPGVRFVAPRLVAEIEFLEWTHRGLLRAPSFKGLRFDKAPGAVVREE